MDVPRHPTRAPARQTAAASSRKYNKRNYTFFMETLELLSFHNSRPFYTEELS